MAWNTKTGKWEPTPEAAAINKQTEQARKAKVKTDVGITGGVSFDRAAMEATRKGIVSAKESEAEKKTQADKGAEKRMRDLLGIGYPQPSTGIDNTHPLALAKDFPSIADIPSAPITKPTPIITPTPVAAPTGIASIDQPAPGGIDTWTPARNMPSAPVAAPGFWGKAKGIASGIGKWAEDPKIARALMTAGLQTLATEPRRVPYSDAEMLGRAGIAGIGAYDTEVAKEAAGREATRKAGIEGRETSVKEMGAAAELGKLFTPASVQAYMADPSKPLVDRASGKSIEVMEGKPFRDKDGQWYTPYLNKNTGDVVTKLLTTSTAVLGREPKGEGAGGIDEWIIKKAAEVKAKTLEETGGDVEEANRRSSEFKTAVEKERQGARWQAAPEVEKLSWLESLFTKQPESGVGRYVGGTQYTPEQIAAERKRRGL